MPWVSSMSAKVADGGLLRLLDRGFGRAMQVLERARDRRSRRSVTPCAPSCNWPSVRVMATVAVWLASLMSRAISSLLSIIVWVKTKLLASIDFTA